MNKNKRNREIKGGKLDGLRSGSMVAAAALFAAGVIAMPVDAARADEGGVSFWLPGIYGSLAATPLQPGWTLATSNYFDVLSASGNLALSREVEIGKVPVGLSASINASLSSILDLQLVNPTYVFDTKVLGGQAAVGVMGIFGQNTTSLSGTLSGTLTLPGGGSIPFSRSDALYDSTGGYGDLYPQFSLRWNSGVDNFMTYVTGDIPIGLYNSTSLANFGIGHGAIDAGGGYTYFDEKAGREFSVTTGLTYNLINPATNYQNGVDWHLDWGASQFLSKQFFVGLVGYVYKEIGCDSGSGDRLGCFQSQVAAVGPQFGVIFPVGDHLQEYLNVKGYKEFAAEDRPSGYNAWITFALSPAPKSTAATQTK